MNTDFNISMTPTLELLFDQAERAFLSDPVFREARRRGKNQSLVTRLAVHRLYDALRSHKKITWDLYKDQYELHSGDNAENGQDKTGNHMLRLSSGCLEEITWIQHWIEGEPEVFEIVRRTNSRKMLGINSAVPTSALIVFALQYVIDDGKSIEKA